jgi:hypothetical protein
MYIFYKKGQEREIERVPDGLYEEDISKIRL